jgi:LacI family transcriptional regulator
MRTHDTQHGRPTIRDVAQSAGVSFKTVSRVMNKEAYVSDATRTKVQNAIKELGYHPNPAAQGLRRATSRSIALVVEDITEPVAGQFALAIDHAVAGRSLLIVASMLGEPTREREVLESLVARQVDGIILGPTPHPKGYLAHRLGRTAMVCVDRPAQGFTTDVVLSDNAAGMRQAVDHLLSRGHHRIAYLGDAPEVFTQAERLAGYRASLAAAGIDEDPALVYEHTPDVERTRAHLRWLSQIPEPPTAFVSGNSLTTLTLIHAGFDVGSDAFIGFDDFPLADVLAGGVSVVAQDTAAIGAEAADVLLRRIDHDAGPARTTRLATRLVLRGRGAD